MSHPHHPALPGSDHQGIQPQDGVLQGPSDDSKVSGNVLSRRPVPMPRKVFSSPKQQECTSYGIGMEDSMGTLNLSDDQQVFHDNEVQRVEELRKEEVALEQHIMLLRREKQQIVQSDSHLEELRRKESDLAEREHNLHLMKSQLESENGDKEFKLNQERRELQHLQDQLHMKSKDLKQREFDIANAESPADISSSQLAELADRQYELEHREQDLQYREERLRQWSINLQEKENEYKRRLDYLQHREASLHSQTPTSHMHYQNMSDSNPDYEQHSSPPTRIQGFHDQQIYPPQGVYEHHPTSPYENTAPGFNMQRYTQQVAGDDHHFNQRPNSSNARERAPVYSSQQITSVHEKEFVPEQTLSDQPTGPPPSKQQQNQHSVRTSADQLAEDLELARQIMEEEAYSIKTAIYTDEMLALTLQQEEMDSSVLTQDNQDGGAASLIKKELDERLTEEQRKKQQEEEDSRIARLLQDSDAPADNASNT